jgi:hypothetical protein
MSAPGQDPASRITPGERLIATLDGFLREEGAGARRARVLAETAPMPAETLAALAALDTIIDGLIARARPRTGTSQRPKVDPGGVAAPPPVPPAPPPPPPPQAEAVAPAPPRPPQRDTTTRPLPRGEPADGGHLAVREPVGARNPATQLLYDDVLNLSAINDWDAAFISIERMLVTTKVEGHIKDFVKNNEAHLLGLYEPALKSFGRTPKRRELKVENTMHRAFFGNRKIQEILGLVDAKMTIKKMFDASKLSKLEVCACLIVLQRAGVIEV